MRPRKTAQISALVADPTPESRIFTASTLASAGFHVSVAASFEEAQRLIAVRLPTLVVADIRLGEYNGLHLVLNIRFTYPHVAAVVTYDVADRALQAEAHRSGATFVTKPVTAEDLLAATLRTLWRAPDDKTPVDAPFERRVAVDQRRQSVPVLLERRNTDRRRDLSLLIRDTSAVM